ncbi:GntR family transcriptional regulator [Paenibacillus beijingensis]|uniref:GntR family transcriptional regulator n=1 Tax=Paenibacillus beijingensis TaxID=1126833 RepID=A0A0D5NQH1_9BACL|nr:GntR family transcriptional regulator [Paenibacillus beijingensis]
MTTKYLSLKEHVYEYIAERIQNGTLLPKQKVKEDAICKALNVSRTPVREALIQLASDNLLEFVPRKGFTVKELDTKKKLDVFQIIGTLDALAATLAVGQLSDKEIAQMEALVIQIDHAIEQQNYNDYQKYQNEFHNIYVNKCHNDTLIELLKSLQNSFIRNIYLSENKQKLFTVLEEMNRHHKTIIQLFLNKDKQKLEDFIKNVHWKIDYTDMI